MSASACVAFYGLRFEIRPAEIESLEKRIDLRMIAARKAGLKHYWANFGAARERYLLFVGAQLSILGPENSNEASLGPNELMVLFESTNAKLRDSGLCGEPSLYLQWLADDTE